MTQPTKLRLAIVLHCAFLMLIAANMVRAVLLSSGEYGLYIVFAAAAFAVAVVVWLEKRGVLK